MSSIPFSHYLCQSLKRYGVFFAGKQIECCLSLFYKWAAFCLRKNQAIRLYLFLASAKIPQRFSSRRRLLLYHTRNKKDTASILCRTSKMYIHVHFWLRVSDKAETSLLRGTSGIRAASELTHPCQCLDVCLHAANSLLWQDVSGSMQYRVTSIYNIHVVNWLASFAKAKHRFCLIRPSSMAVLNKTRSNQMYMDVYLVAMASVAVLNVPPCQFLDVSLPTANSLLVNTLCMKPMAS